MILADFTIDDATMKAAWAYVQWALLAMLPVITGIGYAIRRGWLSLVGFIKPKVETAFEAHTNLVNTMADQVPVVSETLAKISETQEQQRETLSQHSKLHELHEEKLTKIMGHLSSTHEAKQ